MLNIPVKGEGGKWAGGVQELFSELKVSTLDLWPSLHKENLGLSHFESHTKAIFMPESNVYYGNILGDAEDCNTLFPRK